MSKKAYHETMIRKILRLELHWQILIAILFGWVVGKILAGEVGTYGLMIFWSLERAGIDFSYFPSLGAKLIGIFDFIGTLFLNALRMIVIPLIVSSIIAGVGNISSRKTLGRMGGYTFFYYMLTSFLAILVGLVAVNIISPGMMNGVKMSHLLGLEDLAPAQVKSIESADLTGMVDVLLKMLPPNIIGAAYEGQFLGIITFSLLFGYGLGRLKSPYRKSLLSFWQGSYDIIMNITHIIIAFAPIGVFALIVKISATTGYEVIKPLIFFFLTVVLALAVHFFVTLPLILKFIARVNPIKHYVAMAPAVMTAFSTSSSSAALPVTIECVEEKAGVSNSVTSFVLPLGATINMDGTALYECVAAMFIAQVYGLELGFAQQFIIAFTALVTSIGVAGVPSASLVAIAVILGTVGLPLEGIGIILAVDRVLDMMRTSVNIFGDSCGAVVVAKLQGEKGILE